MFKKVKTFVVIMLIIILLVLSPSYQWVKSVLVMSVYSQLEEHSSLLTDSGMKVLIPGGNATKEKDWYPFVMTFNDDYGFSRFVQRDMRMTVLYNFGYFSPIERQSLYYDTSSPFYNSFYGAYAVSDASGEAYGFNQDGADLEAMGKIPEYDMIELVLESIGSYNNTFEYVVESYTNATLFGESDWIVYDADMRLNGSMHTYKKDYQAYIQYGRPPKVKEAVDDFEIVKMYGKIYAKYYEPQNVTLFFYCIAKEEAVIEAWERDIMAKTTLKIK
jgi:hypothetical protein